MSLIDIGHIVRVNNPLDENYECEAEVRGFNKETGEYLIQFTTGDAKDEHKFYSSSDLKTSR